MPDPREVTTWSGRRVRRAALIGQRRQWRGGRRPLLPAAARDQSRQPIAMGVDGLPVGAINTGHAPAPQVETTQL